MVVRVFSIIPLITFAGSEFFFDVLYRRISLNFNNLFGAVLLAICRSRAERS